MAADTVPGARGSLARTSVISQPAPRAPGPRLGALGGGGPRETSLSCPTKAGPRGNSGTGKQNHLCPRDTGKSGRWPWSRSPLTLVHLRVSRSVFTEHFLGARPWAGSWEHSSKQGRPIAVPKELMFLVGGGHKNRKVKPVILHLPSTQLREPLCSLTCERAGRGSCATISRV